MLEDLKKSINELGGDEGFWKSGTESILLNQMNKLTKAGFLEADAFEIVESIWTASKNEYGQ